MKWSEYPELTRMWKTSGARFGCHARLEKRNLWTSYTISLASTYIIILSIFEPVGLKVLSSEGSKVALLITVFLSVCIIFLSLIEASRNNSVRAEVLHTCAKDIRKVSHRAEQKIKSSGFDQKVDLSEFVLEYDEIVSACSYNHEQLDRDAFEADNIADFPKENNKRFVRSAQSKVFWDVYGAFIACLTGVPLLFLLVIWVYPASSV